MVMEIQSNFFQPITAVCNVVIVMVVIVMDSIISSESRVEINLVTIMMGCFPGTCKCMHIWISILTKDKFHTMTTTMCKYQFVRLCFQEKTACKTLLYSIAV